MTPDLPSELKSALERQAEGLSRKDAAQRASAISATYRSGGNSKTIASSADALAYALARMPATYAAVAACLNALEDIIPEFAPASLLDVGAGPGTASWAAAEAYSSLEEFTLLDSNTALRDLALALFYSSSQLADANYLRGDARMALENAPAADLVVGSYVINELADSDRKDFADALWSKTRDTLLVVEPGTPAGYERIIELRSHLIAKGAHVAAPCPHDNACPLVAPDWCHFSQRLQRSRAHKHLKGADLPYEDERFSYVVLTRAPVTTLRSRVLAQPKVTKIAVTAKLCSQSGVETANVAHRDKTNYARARKWNWGDVIFHPNGILAE